MLIAVKIISDTPVYMSFDQITVLELLPGEVYEIPEEFYAKRKDKFQKLTGDDISALVEATAAKTEEPKTEEPKTEEVKDDSVQSASVSPQNRTVRKFQSKD